MGAPFRDCTWGLALVSCALYARVSLLSTRIGPVDWVSVLKSPTLVSVAWALSASDETVLSADAVSRELGAEPNSIEVCLTHPIEFKDGMVYLCFQITNNGGARLVVPPISAVGRIPHEASCSPATVTVYMSSILGRRVAVVEPGQSTNVTVRVPGSSRPVNTDITFFFLERAYCFWVSGGGGRGGRYPYESWSDVPARAIEGCNEQ